ncbi:hypothetical protein [Bythopirellula goksoeyrii]|nr:hypothetical protein [Bythopirellula goksoeyrii]
MIIDFPSSLIFGAVGDEVVSTLFHDIELRFTVGYATLFMILGGIQYYFLARLLCYLAKNTGQV